MARVFTLLFCLFAMPAFATIWEVDTARSALEFKGTQSGEAFTGRFARFKPEITLDPAKPETGVIRVEIDMGSVVVDGKDRQEAITTHDWFDINAFPKARFASRSIAYDKKTKRYLAEGTLTLKNVAQPVTLSFTLATEKGETVAIGQTQFSRRDFNVGLGDFESEEWIAYPVEVRFRLVATPKA
jgi:polyisoprenoid-binding protein YceI